MLKAIGVALGAALVAASPHVWKPQPTVRPESVSQIESGVWWVGQPKVGPALPPPSQVPAGGMWVSSTTAGTVAVSALRFSVGANDRQPILTIPIASLTQPPAALPVSLGVTIVACPTVGSWKAPAKGTFGALGAAPKSDCSKGQVLGALTGDGKSMVFELTQFVTNTNKTISVVLAPSSVPAPVPSAPVALPVALPAVLVPPTFDATFKPVTLNAVEVLTASPQVEADVLSEQLDETPRVEADASPSAAPAVAATTPRATRRTGLAALPSQLAQTATNVVHKGDSARTRTIAAVVFFDLCLWAWWVSNRDPLPGTPQAGRPYRTLYDGASPVTTARRRLSNAPRDGKPPPLR